MLSRLLAAALIVVTAIVLLLAAWPQLVGAQYLPLVAQVVSLRAIAAVAAGVLAVVLLATALAWRRFRRLGSSLAVLLLVFVGVSAAVLATRGFGDESAMRADSADDSVTVLAWNTLGDVPGAERIAELALESGAEVVALPETTEATAIDVARIMKAGGRAMWVHHVSFDDEYDAKQTALLTSVDLGTYSVDGTRGNTEVVPTVIASPDDGSGPVLVAAHPVAPIPGYLDEWRSGLEWLRGVCTGPDVIMAGDLNSTLDHWAGLANGPDASLGDCADAATDRGAAAIGTWPTRLPAQLGSPIDHVLATRNWTATAASVIRSVDDAGSDHRPIVATFEPSN